MSSIWSSIQFFDANNQITKVGLHFRAGKEWNKPTVTFRKTEAIFENRSSPQDAALSRQLGEPEEPVDFYQ